VIGRWWRNRRRKRILSRPFPESREAVLRDNVWQYARLSPAERQKLRDCTQIVEAEKYWEGCGGLTLTEEIRATIAGQASLLLLGWDGRYFDHLKSVLVYPTTYMAPNRNVLPGGVVVESMGLRLGESWHQGPVIISWENVNTAGQGESTGASQPGHNVVIHEFAHVLDQDDDVYNGTPTLQTDDAYRTWKEVMTAEFRRLNAAAGQGRPTLLDHYGAENPAEFFAVATECFFEQPGELSGQHPRLYNLLCDYYRQEPAAWDAEQRVNQ